MKILRILVIATMLNVPCAYAMEKSSTINSIVTPVAKAACLVGGLIVMHDGIQTSTTNKGTILLPAVSKELDDANQVCRSVVGLLEVITGYLIALGWV